MPAELGSAAAPVLLPAVLLVSLPGGGVTVVLLLAAAAVAVWWWRSRSKRRVKRHRYVSSTGVADPPLIFPILPSDPPEVLHSGTSRRRRERPAPHRSGGDDPLRPPERRGRGSAPERSASPSDTAAQRPPQAEIAAPPGEPATAEKPPRRRKPRKAAEPQQPSESVSPDRTPRKDSDSIPPAGRPARPAPAAVEPAEPYRPAAAAPAPAQGVAVEVDPDEAELFEGSTVRYYRPVEGTVQFLPGRLEIVDGEDRGQDIRFVRLWGVTPEVTFGRSSGPPHRHVQLRARTVSREHARMSFEQESWRIHNLSRTNPVLVNGQELDADEQAWTLRDGDLIEMGEVVFRFRER